MGKQHIIAFFMDKPSRVHDRISFFFTMLALGVSEVFSRRSSVGREFLREFVIFLIW